MRSLSLLAAALFVFVSQEVTRLYSSEVTDQSLEQAALLESLTGLAEGELASQEFQTQQDLVFVKTGNQTYSEDLGDDQGYWIWVDKNSGTGTPASKNNSQGIVKRTSNTSRSTQRNNSTQAESVPSSSTQTAWITAADFLLWSTNFNSISAVDADILTGDHVKAKLDIKHPPSTWDPGVRLTLGYVPGFDHWDVQGMWTYFYNSASSGFIPLKVGVTDTFQGGGGASMLSLFSSVGNGNIVPLKAAAAINGATSEDVGFTEGGSKFSLRYNAADLALGKSYFISRHFYVRPFTGIHAIWTDIDAHYALLSGGDIFNSSAGEVGAHVHLKIDSWGLGPQLGFNTNWGQFKGFSLIGNIAGSIVYGQIKSKTTINLLVDPQTIDITFHDSAYWQLMPTLQTQFGVSYCTYFGESDNQFRVNAMWESNFLWEVGNLLVFDKAISMQGLTLSFEFIF